ncbi:hypothetical protein [Streptomyces melanogenes]|uniref:hypothetical protein n=1 Tax=Streptomyces melanogenes TaxID=67326 RepID=UPI00167D09D0|nr:hypothetical protein [Streptomyces melanogenes]
MPDPDDFAAYLKSLDGDGLALKLKDEAFKRAAEEAETVIRHAATVRQAAIEAGFSLPIAEHMALDYWDVASGLGDA